MSALNLRSRTGLMLVEQGANTGWNFLLGTLVARWGGVEVFGRFSVMMAVYFVLTAALGAMTFHIISIDLARLSRARRLYLVHARKSAELVTFPVIGLGGIVIRAIATTFPPENRWIIATVGVLYLAVNMLSDIRRRILALSEHIHFLSMCSFARVVALAATAASAYVGFDANTRVAVVVVSALVISFIYSAALGLRAGEKMGRDYRLSKIAFARQTQLGGWGFATSLVMNGLDPGLMIYAGMIGLPTVAAEIRSGSYLFGVMSPIMSVVALVMPSVIHRFLGRTMQLSRVAPFVLGCALISCVVAGTLSLLNAKVWLPFLGHDYVVFQQICYWVGISFAFMTTRSFMTPFLNTRAPRATFHSGVVGTFSGFAVVFLSPAFDALAICQAMVFSAAIQLLMNGTTLVLLCTRPELFKINLQN